MKESRQVELHNARRLVSCLKRWEVVGAEGTDFTDRAWDILPKDIKQWLEKKATFSRQFRQAHALEVMFDGDLVVGRTITYREACRVLDMTPADVGTVLADAGVRGYTFNYITCDKNDVTKTIIEIKEVPDV